MATLSGSGMSSRIPVVVILGATGSGKSKLGIEIARKFGGEILSADSMQVYKGLDIVTNKVTPQEQLQATHHLLDIVEPSKRFTVLDFRNRAIPLIETLMKKNKMPVIVGGTNYYIESLLWKVLVENENSTTVGQIDSLDAEGSQELDDDSKKQGKVNSVEIDSVLNYSNRVTNSDSDMRKTDTRIGETLNSSNQSEDVEIRLVKIQDEVVDSLNSGNDKTVSVCSNCQKEVLGGDIDKDAVVGEVSCSENSEAGVVIKKNLSEIVVRCEVCGNDKMSPKNEIVVSSDSNSELVFERDRKRFLESLSMQDMDSKRIKLQDGSVNLLDEVALEDTPSHLLYKKLQEIDPEMAQQLHPNNKRKIIRSLQVFAQTGQTHSAILQVQRSEEGGSELGGPLRYPHSCILWLQCKQDVLDERLDARVDTMLKEGLIQELLDFHKHYNEERLAANLQPDYTKGIFQSIGFKEFHEYLILNEEERNSEKGTKLLEAGIAALKLVTRRYARRQIRWITNRFLRRPDRQVPSVYGLDATDPSKWDENVLEPAVKIMESYLKSQKPTGLEPLPITERPEKNDLKTHHCEVCDRIFVGDIQWNDHLQSKKHHKMLKRKQIHKD